jgi:hypothetical protein
MIVVLIRNDQYYAVGKVLGTSFSYISSWQPSSAIRAANYNDLNVSWDPSNGHEWYVLKINGTQVKTFTDTAPFCVPGATGLGYVAVVTDKENFPGVPVKVSFQTF